MKAINKNINMEDIVHTSGKLLTNCHPYMLKFGKWNGLPVSYFSPSSEFKAHPIDATHRRLPNHPTIVKLIGSGRSRRKNRDYWVYEQVPHSLDQLLKEELLNRLSLGDLIQIGLDVATALHIVLTLVNPKRLDFRPTNIWIDENYRAKLHGIELWQHCGHGQVCTCSWFPEWAYNDSGKTSSVDDMDELVKGAPKNRFSYAFGLIFSEVLQRRRLSRSSLSTSDPRKQYLPKTAPLEVQELIRACWADSPSDRLPMKEIVQRLKGLLQLYPPSFGQVKASPRNALPLPPIPARLTRTDLKRDMQRLIDELAIDWTVTNSREVLVSDAILGSGGFSTVYKGKFENKISAVKRFHTPTVSSDPEADLRRVRDLVAAFKHEVTTMMALAFPGGRSIPWHEGYVVGFRGACRSPPLIVYELLPLTLRAMVYQFKRFTAFGDQVKLLTIIANSVNYLHSARVPHLDIKLDNILLNKRDPSERKRDFDYDVKLADLSHVACGSWAYKPPECLPHSKYYRQADSVNPYKVDIWSFGVILCEICSREEVFPNMQEPEIAKAIADTPSYMEGLANRIQHPELRKLVQKCFDFDPSARPNAQVLVRTLTSVGLALGPG